MHQSPTQRLAKLLAELKDPNTYIDILAELALTLGPAFYRLIISELLRLLNDSRHKGKPK